MPVKIRVIDVKKGVVVYNSEQQKSESEDISCQICLCGIGAVDQIWTCIMCRTDFHLKCIQKWRNSKTINSSYISWSCPNCRNETKDLANHYYCYCGKTCNPGPKLQEGSDYDHACSNTCGLTRKTDEKYSCKHPCTLKCHPGKCPTCTSNVTIICSCGNQKIDLQCNQVVNKENLIKPCDQICNKILACGKHKCQKQCHFDECDPCNIILESLECSCGKTKTDRICGDSNIAYIFCKEVCGRLLSCGKHYCQELCHFGDCKNCPFTLGVDQYCYCGKKRVSDILKISPNECIADSVSCNQTCEKNLSCYVLPEENKKVFHKCTRICHPGECGPCTYNNVIKCRCKKSYKKCQCSSLDFTNLPSFVCEKTCNAILNCKKHVCMEKCCVKESHPCPLPCGKIMKCGLHYCPRKCHSGSCRNCNAIINDILWCNCGMISCYPPITCHKISTICPNICPIPCLRGHNNTHRCHLSIFQCPPCTELMTRMCNNDHCFVANVECLTEVVLCSSHCGKRLNCGHLCERFCHIGPCDSIDNNDHACHQKCRKEFPDCLHLCESLCHYPKPCHPEKCTAIVLMTCKCGYRKLSTNCDVFRWYVKIIIRKTGNQYNPGDYAVLLCDELCKINQRNLSFARSLGLNIPTNDENPDLGDYRLMTRSDISNLIDEYKSISNI